PHDGDRHLPARVPQDETGQALPSVLLGLGSLEDAVEGDDARAAVRSVRELVVRTLQDVRELAVELRPKVLDDFGLVPALERLTETLVEQSDLEIEFLSRLEGRLPEELETALYPIIQEALTTVVTHAASPHPTILL